jgi:hypothetical protein
MCRPTQLLILIFVFVTGCIAEYDDGPFISLRSHYGRLKGTWDLEYLVVDGIDSTSHARNQPCYAKLIFTDEDNPYAGGLKIIRTDIENECFATGGYELSDDCDNLTLVVGYTQGSINQYNPICPYRARDERLTWTITKLSSSKLWLEIDYKGMFCWMHLKKD